MNVLNTVVEWIAVNQAAVLGIMGLLTPIIVGALATCNWSSQAKGTAALVVAVIAGFITAAAAGQVTLTDWAGSAFIILGLAQTFYVTVLKPAGVSSWLLERFGRKDPVNLPARLGEG